MRILIENSEYWLRNNGDLAMLEVTIDRLRQRWPAARIGVLTDSPGLLRAYFPTAEGITVHDPSPWSTLSLVDKVAERVGPRWAGPIALGRLRTKVWLPRKIRGARRRIRRKLFPDRIIAETVIPTRPHTGSICAAQQATVVLALGGGYITDSDKAQTNRVMNLFDHALAHSVPVAMLGQGLGPMTDPTVLARCAEVLPRLELIALREKRRGPGLLDAMGVDRSRVVVTGDDAIELAYNVGREPLGDGLGVCLRVAPYSPVDAAISETVGHVVRTVASERGAPLVPLIIAEYRSQDRRSTLPLVRTAPHVIAPLPRYVSPREVAERVSQCRVLVTGAYHLAVFALSQGIPVVAITSSEYYDDKFLGLGDMFGQGLTLIRLGAAELGVELGGAIASAWDTAVEVREPLRARARDQISLSRDAFERVHELIERSVSERT